MTYYYVPLTENTNYSNYISSDFELFYYNNNDWLSLRPSTLYNLYPIKLPIIQDPCYSGYTYKDPNFEGTYFGVSYTPTNIILFVYKQFNTDILFQSIYAPTSTFKVPTKLTILQLETDINLKSISIKLDNLNDTTLLLT